MDLKPLVPLQKAPVLTQHLDRLPQAQKNLNQVASTLEKASQQPQGLAALSRVAQEPEHFKAGLEKLQRLAISPQDKASVESLHKAFQPVLSDPQLHRGLKQVDSALQPYSKGPGKQQILALKKARLDTPVTRQLAQQLKNPQTHRHVEQVTQGMSQAKEMQRATEAQQNRLASIPAEVPAEFGDSLAKIISEAQAANRPRSLFGIAIGGGRPVSAPTPAPAARPSSGPSPAPGTPAPSAQPKLSSAPTRQKIPGATQGGAPQPTPVRESISKARLDAYRQTYEMFKDQSIGKGTKDHPWALVYHSRDAEGAKGLADTLESNVVKGGSEKLQGWLKDMTRNPDSTVALSAILANLSNVAPDRLMGILLLTTDGEGGKEQVASSLHTMSKGVDSSLRLAHFLEQSSSHPQAAKGLAEMLESMTEPKGENWDGAGKTAETFRGISETVGGSRRLAQTLENLGEVEGGNRLVARTFNRMSRTSEGAQATLETLGNLAHDKEGAGQLGKLLARASESRDGARDVLTSLQSMSKGNGGKQEVARLFVRLAEGGQGSRLLANFAKDGNNSGHLAQVFEQLSQNSESRQLLAHALDQMAKHPRQRANFEVFAGRVACSEALQSAMAAVSADSRSQEIEEREVATEVQRVRPVFQRLPEAAEQLVEAQHRPGSELANISETWRQERPSATEAVQAGPAQTAQAEKSQESSGPEVRHNFRPGDVYSEETLRQARICAECGGRTSSLGYCPRCSVRKQAKSESAAL